MSIRPVTIWRELKRDMESVFETIGVVVLAGLGAGVGYWFSRFSRKYWLAGYFIPLAIVLMVGACQWVEEVNFIFPFSRLMAGRNEFVLMAVAAMMLAGTLVFRMPRKREKILLMIFVSGFVAYYSVMPFLGPVFVRGELERLKTEMDQNGVCRQGTDYTCGPAAAVTALRFLGVRAEEGRLAIASHTSSYGGTPGDLLALAIKELYERDGVVCEYRLFHSISEMKDICPVIAQVKFKFLIDHFVTVLQVTDKYVVVGDPLFGRYKHSRRGFESIWRYSGVVVSKRLIPVKVLRPSDGR